MRRSMGSDSITQRPSTVVDVARSSARTRSMSTNGDRVASRARSIAFDFLNHQSIVRSRGRFIRSSVIDRSIDRSIDAIDGRRVDDGRLFLGSSLVCRSFARRRSVRWTTRSGISFLSRRPIDRSILKHRSIDRSIDRSARPIDRLSIDRSDRSDRSDRDATARERHPSHRASAVDSWSFHRGRCRASRDALGR